jgi:hypothetical protein
VTGLRRDLPLARALLLALVVIASALVTARAAAEDMLVLTSGVRTGTLADYANGICTFDDAAIPRASIYFIGLDAKPPVPTPQDPMQDEVHLRDGAVRSGRLLSIDADQVVTETASFARGQVDWIWLTPAQGEGSSGQAVPPATTSDAEEEAGPTYAWEGTVKVENRYNGGEGRHLWQAEYRAKFLEVPRGSTLGRDLTTKYPTADIVPVELVYRLQADQAWDRGGFALQTNAAGKIVYADVTMRGEASGQIAGDRMRAGGGIGGGILLLRAPLSGAPDLPESLASASDYHRSSDNVRTPVEPGWYEIIIGGFPHDTPREHRTYYRGIERGGQMPPFFPNDADEELLHWIPSYMPDGTVLIGRLSDPDQTAVRGRHSFPAQGPGGPEDREQITIEWSFTRTRQ